MRAHFPRPAEPMGEAWFLSKERHFYTRLAETPVAEADASELGSCLFEIASGTASFGRRAEWETWFRYMLPGLISRASGRADFETLLEPTISAFMVLFPARLEEVYAGFREDALASLGACLTGPELWEGCEGAEGEAGRPAARFLTWEGEGGARELAGWDAGRACGPVSASLFFCLQYLNDEEVGPWFESAAAMGDLYFLASLAVWLLGALDVFEGEAGPRAVEKSNPRVRWGNSFLLEPAYESRDPVNDARDFLPRARREAFVRAARRVVTPERLLAWAEALPGDALLYENLYGVPDRLFDRLAKGRAL